MELGGEDFSVDDVPGPSSVHKRTRGRPARVVDPFLDSRRWELLRLFDQAWLDIGLGLQTLYRRADVPKVFKAFPDDSDTLIQLLRTRLNGRTIKRIESVVGAYDAQRMGQIIQWVDYPPTSRSSELIAKAADKLRRNRRLFQLCKARFAQEELANFCGQKTPKRRRELSAWNLACALAGSPAMGWRKSMDRCLRQFGSDEGKARKLRETDGSRYSTFRIISRVLRYVEERTPRAEGNQQHEPAQHLVFDWLKNAHLDAKMSLRNLREHKEELLKAVRLAHRRDCSKDERPYIAARYYYTLLEKSKA